jgi:hypothetical protein
MIDSRIFYGHDLPGLNGDWNRPADRPSDREAACDSLQAQKELLHLILDVASEAILGLDEQGWSLSAPQLPEYSRLQSGRRLGGDKHLHALIHHSHADGSPYPLEKCPINRTLTQVRG